MAHFRAVIRGQRSVASRLGSKSSGITTRLQTWGWDVVVNAFVRNDRDLATIQLVDHNTGVTRNVAYVSLTDGVILCGSECDQEHTA